MKTIGLIGGISPESTVEYYRFLVNRYREISGDNSYPPIIINSIDMTRMISFFERGDLNELVRYLTDAVESCARGGAQICAMASNTPHAVYREVAANSPVPMVSIVESVLEEAAALKIERIALFGTRFTMEGPFYGDVLGQRGIAVEAPGRGERDYIHNAIFQELVHGTILESTKEKLYGILNAMITEKAVQGLILGCTELPLIMKNDDNPPVPLLDTTSLHGERILAEAMK